MALIIRSTPACEIFNINQNGSVRVEQGGVLVEVNVKEYQYLGFRNDIDEPCVIQHAIREAVRDGVGGGFDGVCGECQARVRGTAKIFKATAQKEKSA